MKTPLSRCIFSLVAGLALAVPPASQARNDRSYAGGRAAVAARGGAPVRAYSPAAARYAVVRSGAWNGAQARNYNYYSGNRYSAVRSGAWRGGTARNFNFNGNRQAFGNFDRGRDFGRFRDHDRDHRHFRGNFRGGYPYFYGGYGYPYYSYYDPYYYDYGPSVSYSYYSSPSSSYDSDYDSDSLAVDVQRALKRRGYYQGPVDGEVGPGTRSAIRAYQDDHGLDPTGRMDRSLLRSLGVG